MILGQLIKRLEKEHDHNVPHGFSNPHSYRGYYEELAFEPKENTTVGAMLAAAREALGNTYTGWKGGEFKMHEYTPVHLAEIGSCGEELGSRLLEYILAEKE